MQLGSSKAFYLVKMLCEKTDVEALISWPFYVLPRLELWSPKGKRVFVIGDAAHAIPPTVRSIPCRSTCFP